MNVIDVLIEREDYLQAERDASRLRAVGMRLEEAEQIARADLPKIFGEDLWAALAQYVELRRRVLQSEGTVLCEFRVRAEPLKLNPFDVGIHVHKDNHTINQRIETIMGNSLWVDHHGWGYALAMLRNEWRDGVLRGLKVGLRASSSYAEAEGYLDRLKAEAPDQDEVWQTLFQERIGELEDAWKQEQAIQAYKDAYRAYVIEDRARDEMNREMRIDIDQRLMKIRSLGRLEYGSMQVTADGTQFVERNSAIVRDVDPDEDGFWHVLVDGNWERTKFFHLISVAWEIYSPNMYLPCCHIHTKGGTLHCWPEDKEQALAWVEGVQWSDSLDEPDAPDGVPDERLYKAVSQVWDELGGPGDD